MLVSGLNRKSDVSGNFTVDKVKLPPGVTVKQYMQSLLSADRLYCDCVDYDLFPGVANSYNSNSYVRGILKHTGGSTSVDLDRFIGGNDPLPSSYFDVAK